MREILFRGKSLYSDDWLCGYIRQYGNGKVIICDFETKRLWFVDPETVGQYTGLTDKNGKKIFEGDIVKREYTLWNSETKRTRETQIGVVSYSNKECGFSLDKVCNLRKPWDGDTIEIIGNIHDNPELLGGGEGGNAT